LESVDTCRPVADAVERALKMAGHDAIRCRSVADGFPSFGGIAALIETLEPALTQARPDLLSHLRDLVALDQKHSGEPGGKGDVSSRVAQSIVFAITRRISRESHHSAAQIDGIAKSLLTMARTCFRQPLSLVVEDVQNWDRPSLRCLSRAVQLSGPDDRMLFITLGALPAGDPEELAPDADLKTRVAWARKKFLSSLQNSGSCEIAYLGPSARALPDWRLPESPASGVDLLVEVGLALSYQNYERVYLLCDAFLRHGDDHQGVAESHRLAGVAHAQLQDYAAAAAAFSRARELSTRPEFQAHLEYLLGLLATKRQYDLKRALGHYDQGLAILDAHATGSDQEKVERAWLWNGRALVLSLQAKGSPTEAAGLNGEGLALELKAFQLVRELKGPAASYLRHNLLANITFLLEIRKEYAEAVTFWHRAFERYLATDHPGFLVAYDARLGLLLSKAGKPAEAAETLERARATCRRLGDPFYEERVCLALGFVYFTAGRYEDALTTFADGARLAAEIRQPIWYREEMAALLHCLARLNDPATFQAAVQLLQEQDRAAPDLPPLGAILAGGDPAASLAEAGISMPFPSPKMPAYLPNIDLEGTPARDLNRYLVS
jgi:tetratricopeptide (TPR) repeat protein